MKTAINRTYHINGIRNQDQKLISNQCSVIKIYEKLLKFLFPHINLEIRSEMPVKGYDNNKCTQVQHTFS